MIKSPRFDEDRISKIPALHLLQNSGYAYLTPEEANRLRGNRLSNVLLEGVLAPQLRKLNKIHFKGREHPFTEGNILSAIQALKDVLNEGLIKTNEKIYYLLTLGKSLQQSIEGDIKSFTLKYIDWEHPENNVYHVTEEFEVERAGSHQTRRPDIVLFVNGIPLCVIECKSPDIKDAIDQAISQQIRNQKEDEIPKLFFYSQLLLAVSKNEAKFGTTGTPLKFWSVWRERENPEKFEKEVQRRNSILMTEKQVDDFLSSRDGFVREEIAEYGRVERKVTEQDRAIYAICLPERLLELTQRFILFDGGSKKISRYQQYFCVRKMMRRIKERDHEGQRKGGVVWHTQGSGKSLTMVMLAKAIAMEPELYDYKMVLVTDRVELDEQIERTFQNTGCEPEQARTGKHLAQLLTGKKKRIITTVIDKFEAAVASAGRNDSDNIFVLVDEGHRTQYGPRHAKMRRALPNACYIGFTGTPVMKKDKDTVAKFGGLIDVYTIDQAEKDKAVVPLLYEGRHVGQVVEKTSIDRGFDSITEGLSKEQIADLKKKFASTDQLNKAEQKVMRIAWDISEHYKASWQDTDFRAQLVTQDKATALLYKRHLDEFGLVTSEVLISGPDDREGEEDIHSENKDKVVRFWKTMMARFGNEKEYNKEIIKSFQERANPEVIIVVDKLLTGFDAPRNTILYLTRTLKDHTLLQAIARVNRLHDGKEYGFIIDYRGVLQELDKALDLYSDLSGFEKSDVLGYFRDIASVTEMLPQKHSALWGVFNEVRNKRDEEEYEVLLADEELRSQFYDKLSAFSRVLAIALSSHIFHQQTPPDKIKQFQEDLKFFMKLRKSVGQRYAERVDFAEYEGKIKKLVDSFVGAKDIELITPMVNIFDKEAFAQEVEKITKVSAKADTIAHRIKATIDDKWEEDPAFYKKFSELLEEAIKAFRQQRIEAAEYLRRVRDILNSVLNRTGDDIPAELEHHDIAKAYYGIINSTLTRFNDDGKLSHRFAEASLEIGSVINNNRIVNWTTNIDIQNRMKSEIEDCLFELKESTGLEITFEDMDAIMDQCIDVAKVRTP